MSENDTNRHMHFEQIDADAVCEQCGHVNEEDTFICKACGNNLRDQRNSRIARNEQIDVTGGVTTVRLFTGVITTVGIMLILVAAYSVPNIESWLVDLQALEEVEISTDFWSETQGLVYEKLEREMDEYPSTRSQLQSAIDDPIMDDSYNGRYAVMIDNKVIAEANLSRRGNKVYFVVVPLRENMNIRGYAVLEGDEERPTVRNTASLLVDGEEYTAFGYADNQGDGSHGCYIQTSYIENRNIVAYAYRVR